MQKHRQSTKRQLQKNLLVVREILSSSGIPITPLRVLCLRSVMQFKAPFTVQQLLFDLRWEARISPSVARRTLSLYSKVGLVSKIEPEAGPEIVSREKLRQRQRDLNYQWIGQSHSPTVNHENATAENHELQS